MGSVAIFCAYTTLIYHAVKSLGISTLYISEDLDANYGAYDFIYK